MIWKINTFREWSGMEIDLWTSKAKNEEFKAAQKGKLANDGDV